MAPLETAGPATALLRFETGGRLMAVALEHVREVVDVPPMAPYPEAQPGHLGIVNIRGQIIPVVATPGPALSDAAGLRLLVLEFRLGHRFAIRASKVQKVVHRGGDAPAGQTITLDGRPCRVATGEDFLA